MRKEKKRSSTTSNPATWIRIVAFVYGIMGILLAFTPWLTFRTVKAARVTRHFTGLYITGNVAWAFVAAGLGAFVFGCAVLLKRRVPRYVPFLFSITSLLLSVFFFLTVRQENPVLEGETLSLISERSLWVQIRTLTPSSSSGPGLLLAAVSSVVMVLLSYPLTRYLPKAASKS